MINVDRGENYTDIKVNFKLFGELIPISWSCHELWMSLHFPFSFQGQEEPLNYHEGVTNGLTEERINIGEAIQVVFLDVKPD